MAKSTIPESVENLFTKRRVFSENGKTIVKPFKPLVHKVNKEEILYIHDIVKAKYGEAFTVDLVKRIDEEGVIFFRGTFDIPGHTGKGTIYFDNNTFEVVFDNLDRLLKKAEEEKMTQLIE